MSSPATVIPIRPSLAVVERQVADLDDGYTRTANALMEAVMLSGLTQHQLLIVIAVWRKTYGFNKKVDWIGNDQFAALTGMAATKCSTAKNELIRMGVLTQVGRMVGMNKDISEWKTKFNGFSKTFTESVKKTFTETVNSDLPKESNTKDTITKDNKDIKNTLPEQVRAEDEKPPQPANKHQATDEAFEKIFWLAGMCKTGKKNAKSAFRTQYQEWRRANGGTPDQFASFLAGDISSRMGKQFGFEKLHPATYLNGKRWEDEKPAADPESSGQKPAVTVSKSGYVYY
nr:MAG TPA: replication protein O [Caudoviricetes sp.]